MNSEQNRLRAKLAHAARFRPDDAETLDRLRAELKTSRLEEHIRAVVDGWPPLNAEQRDRLAILLREPAAS